MLRIKNNIDLEELKKFGFEDKGLEFIHRDEFGYSNDVGTMNSRLYVDKRYRTLSIDNDIDLNCETGENFEEYNDRHLNTVYELIQAGLVEKTGE